LNALFISLSIHYVTSNVVTNPCGFSNFIVSDFVNDTRVCGVWTN
jgi:hypothetical protein